MFQGTLDEVTKGDKVGENWLPAWSPDGTKLAFSSTRDGNPEIYIVNRDGSGLRRLTNSPSIDITPTWSPSGTQIAFTSDRSGSPQIYVVGVDGLGLSKKTSESFCDRPTWSPAPFNEIAYASRSGPGFDIHVLDLSTGATKSLTFGEGTNESPAFSPTGATSFSPRRVAARRRCSRWRATERTSGRLRRPATTTNRTGPNDWRIDDEIRSIIRIVCRIRGADRHGGLRQEDASGGAPDAAAAATLEYPDDTVAAARSAGTGPRAGQRAAASRCATMRFRRRRSTI